MTITQVSTVVQVGLVAEEPIRQQGLELVFEHSPRPGRSVLVPVRGTLEVYEAGGAAHPVVKLVLDFPEMFNVPAHQRTMILTEKEIARLKSAPVGGLEFVTDQSFE